MRYTYFLLLALLSLASCSSEEPEPDGNRTEEAPESVGYTFSVNVGEPTTRVTYHDNIGAENSPYNPNSNGSNKLTMSWKDGDELVAIRWSGNFDEYVVLKAKVAAGEEAHEITFDATDVAHFKTALEDGERFVLVHGDFVLDASNKDDPKLDFPTSQVTKTGYATHIHHGGVVEGSDLTFRNQDGTLENLRKHEYMVADCYVHVGEADASGNVAVSLSGSEDVEGQNVKMHIAHTLLRLTLFLPDEDFNHGDNDDLIAVSLKDVNMHKIFHRYFRMHPNEPGTTNYYKTSYNDNADKEENPYIRINLVDEVTGKNGVSHRTTNIFGAEGFNPKKPVSVPGTIDGKAGHYFTLYFSLPSRHMGLDGEPVCELKVTAFTRNSAYTTNKTYRLPDDAMQPGQVVPLNVSFANNPTPIKVITDPELGISFTPGFVYANKVDGQWVYGVYENQGQYAGMSHQTLDFGEYFTFGSTDPTEAFHTVGSTNYQAVVPSPFVDVASLVGKKGEESGPYHMLTKAEADRLMARLKEEVKKSGLFLGYYYYDDKGGNTKHKAPGSQNPEILAAAAGGTKTVEELKEMSASVGIYVGCKGQPKYEEQDDYFFLPNAKQMCDKIEKSKVRTCTDDNGTDVFYYLPDDYTDLDATGDESKLTSKFSTQFKFSTWVSTPGPVNKQGFRIQVWSDAIGKNILDGSTNINAIVGTNARPIRAVIY